MDASPPHIRNSFLRDLSLAQQAARNSVSPKRAASQDRVWTKTWTPFCTSVGCDPLLLNVQDKIPILQVFATRIRDGRCSRSGKPVHADTVADDLFAVAKTFITMGAADPRLNSHGIIDGRLQQQIKGMRSIDPAPSRLQPIPFQLLQHAQAIADRASDSLYTTMMDLIWIGYFFLLRPGEFCRTNDNKPLCVRHVSLAINGRPLDLLLSSDRHLLQATTSAITFEDQKNRYKGEMIAHGTSGHNIACPTRALARLIVRLRNNGSNIDTPLCLHTNTPSTSFDIASPMITEFLRLALASAPSTGLEPQKIQTRSLRSGGAMALLCGKIDTDLIKLVGRWRSDAMFRYLHAQTLPIVSNLANTMVAHGAFTLAPNATTPANADSILASVPDTSTTIQTS